MPGSNLKHGRGSVIMWAAISWYSAGSVIIRNGRITASEYVGILGKQVNPMVQKLFHSNDATLQDDNSSIHTQVFSLGLRSMKVHFNIFPGWQNRKT